MTPQQAFANLQKVCAAHVGNLDTHQALQESLRVIGESLRSLDHAGAAKAASEETVSQ